MRKIAIIFCLILFCGCSLLNRNNVNDFIKNTPKIEMFHLTYSKNQATPWSGELIFLPPYEKLYLYTHGTTLDDIFNNLKLKIKENGIEDESDASTKEN